MFVFYVRTSKASLAVSRLLVSPATMTFAPTPRTGQAGTTRATTRILELLRGSGRGGIRPRDVRDAHRHGAHAAPAHPVDDLHSALSRLNVCYRMY